MAHECCLCLYGSWETGANGCYLGTLFPTMTWKEWNSAACNHAVASSSPPLQGPASAAGTQGMLWTSSWCSGYTGTQVMQWAPRWCSGHLSDALSTQVDAMGTQVKLWEHRWCYEHPGGAVGTQVMLCASRCTDSALPSVHANLFWKPFFRLCRRREAAKPEPDDLPRTV